MTTIISRQMLYDLISNKNCDACKGSGPVTRCLCGTAQCSHCEVWHEQEHCRTCGNNFCSWKKIGLYCNNCKSKK